MVMISLVFKTQISLAFIKPCAKYEATASAIWKMTMHKKAEVILGGSGGLAPY